VKQAIRIDIGFLCAQIRALPSSPTTRKLRYRAGGWNVEIYLPIVSIPIIEPHITARANGAEEFIQGRSADRNGRTGRDLLAISRCDHCYSRRGR
jgi:hypothetical protein